MNTRITHLAAVVAFIVAVAPACARADLWMNVALPLTIDPSVLTADSCELARRTSTAEVVRCSNYKGRETDSTKHLLLAASPQGNTSGRTFWLSSKYSPHKCRTQVSYDWQNNRWDAFTNGTGCKQYWQNNNTLDVFQRP